MLIYCIDLWITRVMCKKGKVARVVEKDSIVFLNFFHVFSLLWKKTVKGQNRASLKTSDYYWPELVALRATGQGSTLTELE